MRSGSLPHRLIVTVILFGLCLGLAAPVNRVDASRHYVRYYRRGQIRHRRRFRHIRRRHHRYRRIYRRRINHHYTRPYPTVNDHVRWVNERLSWASKPKYRRETIKSNYGPKVTFKTLCFIPTELAGQNFFVQSLNVIPDGRYAFVGYGHNPALRRGRKLTRIAKVDLRHQHFQISKAFDGGHGQALAYNPVKHSLWLLEDAGGPVQRGSLEEISTNSLKPKHRIRFHLKSGNALGDSLAFDNRNHVYNENLIWKNTATRGFRNGMILLYQGSLDHKRMKLNMVSQGLRHSPSDIVQGIAYNPRTQRIYIESNDAIVSIPVKKLDHLRPGDVKETILRQRREYEGISFDRQGHAYILMNHPKEIMKSTKVF